MSKTVSVTRDEVKETLTEVLVEIQELGGEEVPQIDDVSYAGPRGFRQLGRR